VGLLEVFYAPEKLFEEVGKTSQWRLALIAVLLLTVATTIARSFVVSPGDMVRSQIEGTRVAEQLGPEKIEQMVHDANSTSGQVRTYASGIIGAIVITLIVAALLFGLAQIASAGTSYKKILSVTAYSSFAYGLVANFGGIIVLGMMSDPVGAEMTNLIKLNPTLFMDKAATSKALYSIASSFDLLSFWMIFLLALGISKVSVRMSLAKGVIIVLIPWVLYVLAKAGIATLF
jgi:hypothetical protein